MRPGGSAGLETEAARTGRLGLGDVGCLEPLGSLGDLEFDRLALFQGLVSVTLNRGEMDENIRPILLLDESVPLAVIEPLYLSLGHRAPSHSRCRRSAPPHAPSSRTSGQKKSTKATALVVGSRLQNQSRKFERTESGPSDTAGDRPCQLSFRSCGMPGAASRRLRLRSRSACSSPATWRRRTSAPSRFPDSNSRAVSRTCPSIACSPRRSWSSSSRRPCVAALNASSISLKLSCFRRATRVPQRPASSSRRARVTL